jgi:prevent-host-death family protein
MKSAAVSHLKAKLSECLAKVKAGEELIVLERGKPIAKLVPIVRNGTDDTDQLADLTRAGLIRPGSGALPKTFWKLPRPKDRRGKGLEALFDERAESR